MTNGQMSFINVFGCDTNSPFFQKSAAKFIPSETNWYSFMMNTATILKTQRSRNTRQFSNQESMANETQSLCNPLRQRHFLAVFRKTTKQNINGKVLRTSENANEAADFSCLNPAATCLS